MKFDSNLAWKDAASSVSANRDVLLALAGVFIALPTFAMAIFVPPPVPAEGAKAEASLALMGEYYSHAWPMLIGLALLSLLGTLTMLTLFTDRSRPTVGEAIKQGARAVLPVIAAQLLFGLAIGIAGSVLLGAAIASGSTALKLLVGAGLLLGIAYAAVRVSLVSPVVVVEGLRNPVAALRRSWMLTSANVLRIFLFYALLLIAFLVIYILIGSGLGLLVALVSSGEVAAGINNLIAAFLQSVLSVYSVAVAAAVHRQLAGPSAEAAARPFE
ncbi:hypothetical protein ACFFF7_12305 [Novosphingobium aquiterrae]|uniref:Glycerophosphoryl diester phosphodiesterase membrane domain-containing protein n=1 Tax=Novosphingobium aquiterrae TaxID=624388 RepID=A0ABV6PM90_9SPHN